MAKLYFRYGAMNSGKSTLLLQVAYNYKERDMEVIVIKPSVDTKGDTSIVGRIGVSSEADYLIGPDDILPEIKNVHCILVDEAQFLSKEQVDQLYRMTKLNDIPVMCYGLRTDFKTVGFPGSVRLLEIADDIEELKTICRCGKKATFNGRKVDEEFVFEGEQVAIDEEDNVTYESLCGKCYIKKRGKF